MSDKPIDILYDWRTKEFEYRDDQSVGDLLKMAVEAFELDHLKDKLVLCDNGDRELGKELTLRQAGVEPGAFLMLRQAGDTSNAAQWSGGRPPWA